MDLYEFILIRGLYFGLLINIAWSSLCRENETAVRTKIGVICGVSTEVKWTDRPDDTVHIYRGIPYAKPPIRNLRFRKPVPVEFNRTRVIHALKHQLSCIQYNDTNYISNAGAKMWVSQLPYSEDCLYLNIWVPQQTAQPIDGYQRKKPKKLAVMVWIYGGSFAFGTSSLEVYEGRYLAARQNVIVASMNYRLGPFGFLYLDDEEVPGNMGLWDQRMALKWIKDNVVHFGGDPDRITLFGESAGAVSVSAHVVSPWSQNLFQNAIMQSGSVLSYWGLVSKKTSIERSRAFASHLNCNRKSIKEIANCMRRASPDDLTAAHYQMYNPISYFSVPFPPVIENNFFPYMNSIQFRSLTHLKPTGALMMGMNKNEGSYFLLYTFIPNSTWSRNITDIKITPKQTYESMLYKVLDLRKKDGYEHILPLVDFEYTDFNLPNTTKYKIQRLEEMSSDRSFKCPTIEMARVVTNDQRRVIGPGQKAVKLPTYFYEFRYRTQRLPWPKWMGTIHGLEIDYVFGVPFNKVFAQQFYSFTDEERRISDHIMRYWANFARHGDPNISEPPVTYNRSQFRLWPEFDNVTQSYIVIDDDGNLKVSKQPKKRKCLFWRRWYPAILKEDREIKGKRSCQ